MSPEERDLLVAVREALELPPVDGHALRLMDRAMWVSATLKGFLGEGDAAWHAAWLRDRMRAEEARHTGGAP